MKKLTLSNTSKEKLLKEIAKEIKNAKTFFIAGHRKPDGDALGSGLALASLLRRLGKKVTHCSIDEISQDLKFMPGSKTIKITNKIDKMFDCAIILESMNFERMGNIIKPAQAKFIINIDHHLSHTDFGNINYVVPNSSSVSELIYDIFETLKIKPTKTEAENLYIGIVTDTGRFQQLNTTANSHITAAKLLECGVNSSKICKTLFSTFYLQKLKLYGLALSNINTALDGKLVYIKLSEDMFKKSKADDADTDGIINYCISVPGAVVGCILKEVAKKEIKISFRSIEKFNLLNIVKIFSGGGHKNAAGCTINADMETALKQIVKACRKQLSAK